MKGSECKFIKYMEGSSKRFIIPVYQRNYDWKKENCKQLYNDLIKIVKNNRKSHFFGSVVYVYDQDGDNEEYLVIDGQQRLTTISLLLLAMYNLLKVGKIKSKNYNLAQRIYEEYLVDKWQPDEKRIKLKSIKSDQEAFNKLFSKSSDYIRESNITVNYNYFYERIQKLEITIDELYSAICCLEIIRITLNHEDDPQLIFESLNSTGLDLSEGDKIRNFILMGLSSKKQEYYYNEYWNKIEKFTEYDVSSYIRDYMSIKKKQIISQKKIYLSFKEYVEEKELDIESLLNDLLIYAKRYEKLLKGNTCSKEVNACIYRLNRLETSVTRPFFLEVFRLYDEKKLDIDQVKDIFIITEIYLFRRTICDLPTNSLNKVFLSLHGEIYNYEKNEENYLEKFKYTLLSKKERLRLPNDSEFVRAFEEKQVYSMNSKNKIYIFERLENFGTIEDKDIYRHLDDGDYSIEHIMPQHLTPIWQKELGCDYEKIHELWLHRIANLTLTAYNSKYSNKSFDEKKNIKNGFNDSGIRMNTYIAKKDKWSLIEIKERSEYLKNRALEIWKLPITNYKPKDKILDSYTLEEDSSYFKGRNIIRFSYKNTEHPVVSWVDMYQKVLQILYSEDKSIITKLAISPSSGVSMHFSMNESTFSKKLEIDDGIYVYTDTNTQSKISILNKLFILYNIEPAELQFYLRDENENYNKDSSSEYELIKEFWEYALVYIKNAHGEKGGFKDNNPTKSNWISCGFGIGGFAICCVTNNYSVRVEFYLGNKNKDKNKEAYNILFKHKEEIEEKMETSMIWENHSDLKSAKISCVLEDVKLENKSDWNRMAKFQAKWSKKMYDEIVPYLK